MGSDKSPVRLSRTQTDPSLMFKAKAWSWDLDLELSSWFQTGAKMSKVPDLGIL